MPSFIGFLQAVMRADGRPPGPGLEPIPQISDTAIHSINQRIFDTTLDLILVVDDSGRYIRVSPSSTAIIGYRPDEMIGRNGKGFIHQSDIDIARNEMRLVRQGRQLRNFSCRYRHRDGRDVPLAWTGLWSEPDRQYFFIGRDIAQQLAAEVRARHTQQLEAASQLTGGIAHDFNNLLAVIIGSLELLDPHLRNDFEAGEHLLTALNAALRGAELTGQLLAFSRRRPLNSQVLDINACLGACLERLRSQLGGAFELDYRAGENLWPAVADTVQLEAALAGLCRNAATALGEAGTIIVTTDNRRLDAAALRDNTDAEPGDFVMISVTDSGHGMSSEVLERVLEPFFTTQPVSSGAGLGLSLINGFLRLLHGHMEIDSTPCKGTEVRMYLPRAAARPVTGHADARTATPAARLPADDDGDDRISILVVEDNDSVRQLMLTQLAELGYRTTAAVNGVAALQLLKGSRRFDLLFSDVLMPGGISGTDLARAARAVRPEIRILLTSGFVGANSLDTADAGSYANFLAKPYRKAELAEALKAVLEVR